MRRNHHDEVQSDSLGMKETASVHCTHSMRVASVSCYKSYVYRHLLVNYCTDSRFDRSRYSSAC